MIKDLYERISQKKYLVFDIETDGLLDSVSRLHCGWVYCADTDTYIPFRDSSILFDYLDEALGKGYVIVGHNIVKFDLPCLKLLNKKRFKVDPKEQVVDTLVMARLIYPEMLERDSKRKDFPKKLMGSHSLKAWGYRLGELKGTYGEQEEAWKEFNEDMLVYCKQDVKVTSMLFDKLISKKFPLMAIELEHNIAWLMAKQERNGFCFDKDKAVELYAKLSERRQVLMEALVKSFGSWKRLVGYKTYKRDNTKMGIIAGKTYPIYKEETFNPSSRDHIAKVLKERGWEPTVFTTGGKPQVNEETLKDAPDIPEKAMLLEYLLIQKRISQLAEGDYAWLKMMKDDKDGITKIHGSVNPNGAVTGRATHSYPNVAQVPSGHSPYGMECRSLFKAPEGWYEVGVDASGLELRCFSHFLYPYDNGAYLHEILNGDIHTANQKAAGLPTRDNAKTFVYGFLYGAGDEKIGQIVGKDKAEGKRLREKFLKAVPAIKTLRDGIENSLIASSVWLGGINKVTWKKRIRNGLDYSHCIVGLDGRPVYVRSAHSALNTVLQSAGALICKLWMVRWEENMRKAGYKHGWDGDFCLMAWIHDEGAYACRTKEIAEACVRIAQESMRQVQKEFNFRAQLDTEGKIGHNWGECH